MNRSVFLALFFLLTAMMTKTTVAQDSTVSCGLTKDRISLDGILDEPAWSKAGVIRNFREVEPETGTEPPVQTTIRVLSDGKVLYLGITCQESDPSNILAFSEQRDASLRSEDYVKIVLDTYLDGRTGFIFAVNPLGARYDALVAYHGEHENPNWDAIWDAKSRITGDGWTAEIMLPFKTLTFNRHNTTWGFNVERQRKREQEIIRWTAISKDFKVTNTSRAGRLTDLPPINMGLGITLRGASSYGINHERGLPSDTRWHNSLDITEKITPDISAQLTVNTDFAETEVDSRQTNLTRFSLFYPEKRNFFLQGSDIFDFGMGFGRDLVPFHTRRIGLYQGREVPLRFGGKINGKVGNTNFGGLITQTGNLDTLLERSTMGAFRIKQNILKESNFGVIGTFGDPEGNPGSYMTGVDFTYKTSSFQKDKNFLVGVWGLVNDRQGLTGEKSAWGISLDYPNDKWDIYTGYRRLGDGFNPALGFVPRNGVNMYRLGVDYMPRPKNKWIRQYFFESSFSVITNLQNEWESYRFFTAPYHFRLESGDRFEFNVMPQGENLPDSFEIADNVIIPPGPHHWMRYRLELETASKRDINGQFTWWFGGFYEGRLDQIEVELNLRPFYFLNFALNYERDMGRLPEGDFVKSLFAGRILLNFSPDMQLSSFIQYDNESDEIGTNSRFRWTFNPRGDFYLVYNHNLQAPAGSRWIYTSNQFIVKLTYALWL